MMHNSKPILLVEDDSVDVMAVHRALRDLDVTNALVHAENGEEALSYLKDAANEKPCLVLLDLNMPRMNGIEFLKVLRADEATKNIPVVVVTTSPEEQDMNRSFELGAAAYIMKCLDYAEFRESLRAVERYLASPRPPARWALVPRALDP
jgi:CheY-like chemotaxis protein